MDRKMCPASFAPSLSSSLGWGQWLFRIFFVWISIMWTTRWCWWFAAHLTDRLHSAKMVIFARVARKMRLSPIKTVSRTHWIREHSASLNGHKNRQPNGNKNVEIRWIHNRIYWYKFIFEWAILINRFLLPMACNFHSILYSACSSRNERKFWSR